MQQFAAQEIGERIKEARKEAGLTQEELADLVEVTTRTIQAYEAGDIDAYRKLNKIAQTLGRDVSWFLRGDEELPPGLQVQLADALERFAELVPRFEAALDRLEEHSGEQPEAPGAHTPE